MRSSYHYQHVKDFFIIFFLVADKVIVLAAAKTFNSDFCRQVTNALY